MSWSNFDNSMQNAGGFMDASINEGAGGGDDKGGTKRGQNCMPVMITHLKRHGEKLTVWGIPARIITFVARVRKIEALTTKVTIDFEDETGTIMGVKWLEGDYGDYVPPVTVNSYARVHGMIRDQNDEHYILIVKVQPIEHLNELLTHMMEVTLMCLQGEKNVNKVASSDTSFANNTIKNSSMGNYNSGSSNVSGITKNQQIVLDIIQNGDPEYGAERDEIKRRVPSHMVPEVDSIIEFLSGEGHIYTTKTDDFFKAI